MEDAIYQDVITLPDGRIAVAHERYDASGQLIGKEYIPQPRLQNPTTATPICKATMLTDAVARQYSVNAISGTVNDVLGKILPVGLISLWAGSASSIPCGWYLCDGNNGTPNLKDRFVVCAGGMYNVGDNGGLSSVALTIEEMPSHNHEIATSGSYGTNNVIQVANVRDGGKYNTNYNGGSQSHENRPPYYALCYIMYKGG